MCIFFVFILFVLFAFQCVSVVEFDGHNGILVWIELSRKINIKCKFFRCFYLPDFPLAQWTIANDIKRDGSEKVSTEIWKKKTR